MFSSLGDKEMNIVADAMTVIKVSWGKSVIEENKDGNDMFVVE